MTKFIYAGAYQQTRKKIQRRRRPPAKEFTKGLK